MNLGSNRSNKWKQKYNLLCRIFLDKKSNGITVTSGIIKSTVWALAISTSTTRFLVKSSHWLWQVPVHNKSNAAAYMQTLQPVASLHRLASHLLFESSQNECWMNKTFNILPVTDTARKPALSSECIILQTKYNISTTMHNVHFTEAIKDTIQEKCKQIWNIPVCTLLSVHNLICFHNG